MPLPLHPTFPSSQPLQKDNNPFALHYHPCLLMNALPVSHPCETLGVQLRASMPVPSKGEVLLPERIRATTGGVAFLPHPFRFSDTSVNNPSIVGSASHCNRSSPLHKGAKGDSALPTLPNPHYPSKIADTLASLVKGEVLSPERIRATTGGIATPPSITLRTNPKHYTKTGHKGQKGKIYNKSSNFHINIKV